MKVSESFQSIATLRAELAAKVKAVGIEGIKDTLRSWFEENPAIIKVRWTQYAPHFADGDPCVFGVRECDISLGGDDGGDHGDGFFSSWDDEAEPYKKAMNELDSFLSSNEDILEAVFGNGFQITASRESIDVDEYEHD